MLWGIETFIMALHPYGIAAWLTITPLAQFFDSTSVVLIEFSETMSLDGLLNTSNYKIVTLDSSRFFEIYKIGIVKELDSIMVKETSLVALVTERLPYKTEFLVHAKNLKDKSGNFLDSTKTVWFYFNGFAPNKFVTPTVRLE